MTQEDLMPFVKGLLKKKRKDNRNERMFCQSSQVLTNLFSMSLAFFIAEGETVAAQDP